jgi:esterase
MALDIYAKRAGEGEAVILLHGLFGGGANLGLLARALQEHFLVFSPDLPNHGRSGWLPKLDLPVMADSLRQWMDAEGLSGAHLVGHSLGGKVAMQLALQCPTRVRSLIVADIAPVQYAARHDSVFTALQAVATARCTNREEAARLLGLYLQEQAVIQFLLASLQRDTDGTMHWRFDLQGIRAAYSLLLAAPAAEQAYSGPVLFIKGGESDYIQEQHWPVIQALFPAASIRMMPGCGHWLHVEKPQLFNGIVTRFLGSAEPSRLASTGVGTEG